MFNNIFKLKTIIVPENVSSITEFVSLSFRSPVIISIYFLAIEKLFKQKCQDMSFKSLSQILYSILIKKSRSSLLIFPNINKQHNSQSHLYKKQKLEHDTYIAFLLLWNSLLHGVGSGSGLGGLWHSSSLLSESLSY